MFLIYMAAFVVIVAGMRAAKPLLAPFLLALFVAVACLPALWWLLAHRVRPAVAIGGIALGLLALISAVGAFLGKTAAAFSARLPVYEQGLRERLAGVLDQIASWGLVPEPQALGDLLDPAVALKWAADFMAGLGGVLTSTFLIVFTVVFLLFEFVALPHKWRALGEHAPDERHLVRVLESVKRYLVVKTWISLATGVLAAAWLALLHVDFPLLWGLVAFLLNFVPNIGSVIAAIPPLLLAIVQHSWLSALLVAMGYLLINLVLGGIVEPRLLGRSVGLSALVVFVSLGFWGWVLGPVGMLLSAPLTMIVRIALEADPRTRWLAVLLGPDPEPRRVVLAHNRAIDSERSSPKT